MGIYDREYSREQPSGFTLGGQRSLVTNLLLINVAIYLVDWIFLSEQIAVAPDGTPIYKAFLNNLGALAPQLLSEPWKLYQLLTYGFLHSREPLHVASRVAELPVVVLRYPVKEPREGGAVKFERLPQR